MVVNADKTILIWFSFKKPDVKEQPVVVSENEDVSSTLEPVKDLGILFASTLFWTTILKKEYTMPTAILSISKVSQR